MILRALVFCIVFVAGQDPLGGEYFAPPDPHFFRDMALVATGACAMKVVDATLARRQRRRAESDLGTMRTALDFKRIESQREAYKAAQLDRQVKELQRALYECEAEALQRDYDEFKAPDVDDDDVISEAEFAAYINNYMTAYPDIPREDYPTFADFDKDNDGVVTFKEWQQYLQHQKPGADRLRTTT